MATQKTETREARGIALHRERGQEIREVEPGVYRVPVSEGGGFYRADLNRQTCECADRAPMCKHLFAVLICAAKKRCRRATTERPERRHGQPSGSPRTPTGRPGGNTSARPDISAPRRSDGDSLRGVVPVSVAMAGLERMAD